MLDDSGNVYLLGRFERFIFFTPGGYQWPGSSPSVSTRTFLAKLDSTGNVKWGIGWNANLGVWDMTLDDVGEIHLAGVLYGFGPDSTDVDPDLNKTKYVDRIGGGDCLIMKLSNSGELLKAHVFGGNVGDQALTIDSDGNNGVFISGRFSTSLDADFGPNTYTLTSQATSSTDAFIIKVDTGHNFHSAFRHGSNGFEIVESIITANGYLYNVGHFYGNRDFDPSPTSSFMLDAGPGIESVFIQKLDTAGNFVSARAFRATNGRSLPKSLALVGNDMLISGYFESTVDFDPDPNLTNNITSQGAKDGFVVLLDTAGSLKSVATFGSSDDDQLTAVSLGPYNNLFTAGFFQNTKCLYRYNHLFCRKQRFHC
jgi:hypothetical protein